MHFNTTPILEDDTVLLMPLQQEHFEALYEVASDPLLWEHHPMGKKHTREVFVKFFEKAIEIGALVIFDKIKNKIIGSTRFYNFNQEELSVVIGQTFYAKDYWGAGHNGKAKGLMLNYAFNYVQKIIFYVVVNNFRSRKAVEKLGAVAKKEIAKDYDGNTLSVIVYELRRNNMK